MMTEWTKKRKEEVRLLESQAHEEEAGNSLKRACVIIRCERRLNIHALTAK